MAVTNLYEILVPCQFNDGRKVRRRFHRVWDAKIRAITGGLTVLTPVKGQWIDKGQLYDERMIPVRIACTAKQIIKVADITAKHYMQIKVMYYTIGTDVHVVSYVLGEPVKITFVLPYEGMCGRKALEKTDDPFEDVTIVNGEVFDATITEQNQRYVSFVANTKGQYLKKGDRLFNVPVECVSIQ